ncbi:hypothetical protein OROMI_004139 [Orobanche minor]
MSFRSIFNKEHIYAINFNILWLFLVNSETTARVALMFYGN